MTDTLKIAIVDDDDAVSDSLDVLLRACGFETSVFQTVAGFAAIDAEGFDAILLDVRLPDGDGISVLQGLHQKGVQTPVLIMTGHGDVPMAVRAMRYGAVDFIEKPFDPDQMLASIDSAIEQMKEKRVAESASVEARERVAKLTTREHEIMLALVSGKPNKIIAYELELSPRTVEVHRARIMEKTAAGSLSGLVRLAISAGVDPDAEDTSGASK
ncbi:MAG: response regulator [Pseudomonadota bacterium]